MTNQELFEQYGSEKWVIEQNLCFLLQTYWEECHSKGYIMESHMSVNPVGFVKQFMKEETLCNIKYAEQSKMDGLNDNAIEANFYEL